MVIILHYQFALKCAFAADSIFRGVYFLKALEINESHIAVVWNVTPFNLMDRCKIFGDASNWFCAGWKSESRGSDWYIFGGGMLLFTLKGLFYGIRLRKEEMKSESKEYILNGTKINAVLNKVTFSHLPVQTQFLPALPYINYQVLSA